MTRRSLALALLSWTAVVVLVSFATWRVIDGAGNELGESSADVLPGAQTSTPSTPQPTPTPTASRTPTPTRPGTSPPSGVSPTPTASAQPAVHVRTWRGRAGSVTVACTGDSLRLEGATPSDGYRVDENESDGGREIEVKFKRVSGAEDEVEIHATCRAGTPVFSVDDQSSDD